MATQRRIGTTSSETRLHLLDVAEAMMLEQGYASVTSRKLGARADVSAQLVHYYFRTMDELFVEIFRRRAEENIARIEAALETDGSLVSIWRLSSNPLGAAFNVEFAALANHRKEISSEIAAYGARFRQVQCDALARRFEELGIDPQKYPPIVAQLAMSGTGVEMSIEASVGLTDGHAEANEFIFRFLEDLDRPDR